MIAEDLLANKANVHTENGEDGIIAAIYRQIDFGTKRCCEFGAWDGVQFSNCRSLIQQGWSALMIEGDEHRFKDLVNTYRNNPSVFCINRFVDTDFNSLDSLLQECKIEDLDFLSIDIDGLDFEILETMAARPRVICIEVNAGHCPAAATRLDRDVARGRATVQIVSADCGKDGIWSCLLHC
jgi:hypothetical protein